MLHLRLGSMRTIAFVLGLTACPFSLFGSFFLSWVIHSERSEWTCCELIYGETHMTRNWGSILRVIKEISFVNSHMNK